MRALEQPLLAVQQLTSGTLTVKYRPLMPEDFHAVKVSAGSSSTSGMDTCPHAAVPMAHALTAVPNC